LLFGDFDLPALRALSRVNGVLAFIWRSRHSFAGKTTIWPTKNNEPAIKNLPNSADAEEVELMASARGGAMGPCNSLIY